MVPECITCSHRKRISGVCHVGQVLEQIFGSMASLLYFRFQIISEALNFQSQKLFASGIFYFVAKSIKILSVACLFAALSKLDVAGMTGLLAYLIDQI